MKKYVLFLVIPVWLLFFSGCWDYIEYDNLLQIYALGIDIKKPSNELILTLQCILPTKNLSNKQGQNSNWAVYSARGVNVGEAIKKLQDAYSGILFYGYIKVIVVNKEAAANADVMGDIVEFFDRTPNIRNSADVIITSNKAEGLLSIIDKNSQTSSGEKIYQLVENNASGGATISITLNEFVQMIGKRGVQPIAPGVISTAVLESCGEAKGGEVNGVRFGLENNGNLMLQGVAAFKGSKFVGWLNDRETLGLAFILGKKLNPNITSKLDEETNDSKGNSDNQIKKNSHELLYAQIIESKTKVKVELKNGKPSINIKVKTKAGLRKYYSNNGKYIDTTVIKQIEDKLEKSIKADISLAINKGQKQLDTDIFGFGYKLYIQHTREWNEKYKGVWEDIYKDVPVNVDVEVKVTNTGTNIKGLFGK